MGVFDGKDKGSINDPFEKNSGMRAAGEFSDTTAGSSSTPSGKKADFSDVTSGSSSTAPEQAATGGTTYTVKSGDSLSKIAKHVYGDADKWHRIDDANRDKIKNPDLIHPGQEFTIPDA
jgi:nucleoid-associated protein YgaU